MRPAQSELRKDAKGMEADVIIPDFRQILVDLDPKLLRFDQLRILQVNLGNRCNQSCAHCHVQAGPRGSKIMPRQVMVKIVDFLREHPGITVDVTGGCPELNPDFRFFIEEVHPLVSSITVRTNLTVLLEPGCQWVCQWYSEHGVTVIGSLPCYLQENVDTQRGAGVFKKSIQAIKLLNELGYGCNCKLKLNLVYNPVGIFLPGPQEKLEADYKRHLGARYGLRFNRLLTITNAPIGRFRQLLEANGQLEHYLKLLVENFNSVTAEGIMCRNLVSVDYRGLLYNCDFNQALDLPIIDKRGRAVSIEQLDDILAGDIEIITAQHCFCCTAGAGSSCAGALVKL